MSLLETLEVSLQSSPPPLAASGSLRLHTLVSVPRSVKSLYPLAHIHPTSLEATRTSSPISAYLEHIVVTASWAPSPDDVTITSTSSPTEDATLVYALEAFLYTLPEYGSAVLYISKLDTTGYGPPTLPAALRSRLAVKVLGEAEAQKGYGNTLTAQLSSAFIQHFSTFRHWQRDKATTKVEHLSVHILARSQHAYLFPGSADNGRKKVLSDGGLIKWWRDVMSEVVVASRRANVGHQEEQEDPQGGKIEARAFYIVPGYNRLESHVLLPLPPTPSPGSSLSSSKDNSIRKTKMQTLTEAGWTYGYPYSFEGASCSAQDLPPLPLHWQRSSFIVNSGGSGGGDKPATVVNDPEREGYDPKRVRCISTLMPHFSDDPKTRFMDELQRDAHEHAGWKTTDKAEVEVQLEGGSSQGDARSTANEAATTATASKRTTSPSDKTADGKDKDVAEELPSTSKRAKLEPNATSTKSPSASHVSTTATVSSGSSSSVISNGKPTPLPILRGQMRERRSLDDLSIDEFWLRMGFRQECSSGNAVGVLVCLFTRSTLPTSSSSSSSSFDEDVTVPTALQLSLPHLTIQGLVFRKLMRDVCEWDKEEPSRVLTKSWNEGVLKAIVRKGGLATVGRSQDKVGEEQAEKTVGHGIVWKDVKISAPTRKQIDETQEEVNRQKKEKIATGAKNDKVEERPVTNVLSVKRKKKPAAATAP